MSQELKTKGERELRKEIDNHWANVLESSKGERLLFRSEFECGGLREAQDYLWFGNYSYGFVGSKPVGTIFQRGKAISVY